MDKDRRKELLMEYRQRKPDMGAYSYECRATGEIFIGCSKDIKSALNGNSFKLNAGGHVCKKLQTLWKEHGESSFIVSVLELLPYEEDESKSDYSGDLQALRDIWLEKIAGAEKI